ncbi:MAG: hypothetical protein ACFFDI_26315 [Promethearchaeota archaeon]
MNLAEKILGLVLIIIFVGELLTVTYPNIFQNYTKIDIIDTVSRDLGDKIEFNITFSIKQGNSPLNLRVALMPSRAAPKDKQIYVYYDKDFPSSGVSLSSWIGFIDHIVPNLRLRGFTGDIEVVNASRLAYIMMNDFDSIVIIPSGVFPANVHSKNGSLVPAFLFTGGTLIWIGDGFGVYSGSPQERLTWPSENNPGWEFQKEFLGYQLSFYNEKQTRIDGPSPLSYGLNLNYPAVKVGALISQTLEHGGLVLGGIGGDRTSIAAVTFGKGTLVVFGGGMDTAFTEIGEDVLAYNVANILLSNVLESNGQISANTYNREINAAETITITVPKGEFSGVAFVAYSVDDFSYFFQREFFEIS